MNESTTTTVGELMTTPVVTVSGSATMTEASQQMTRHTVGSVVVVDSDEITGILTERDVLRSATDPGNGATPVSSWMTPEPATVSPDMPPSRALEVLNSRGFRHLPVTDSSSLIGIVSVRDLLPLARIESVDHPGQLEAPRGLAGVIVSETEVGDVRGQEGFYHYRQYAAVDLARQRSLEDVWYLLLQGALPTTDQLNAFRSEVASIREVPEQTAASLPQIAATAQQPLDALRTAVSLSGAELGLQPWFDISIDELRAQTLRMISVMPTLVMALYRLGRGQQPVAPDPALGYASNYLWMMTGETPDPQHARAIEQYLILTADHGFNASTFAARVIASTGADLTSALIGAIGALSGPLHGGAPSRALGLLDEIGDPTQAGSVVRRKVADGERVMGFGHRVYKTQDPRSQLLREVALELGGDRAELAATVEQVVVDVLAELKPGRELYANVEYYTGVVFEQVGLPPELFTPTFVASRSIGWCAHVLEQAANNRLIRPTARYAGPPPPQPVPPRN